MLEAYHERAKVESKIESLICSSLMQEHNIGDDIWLDGLQDALSSTQRSDSKDSHVPLLVLLQAHSAHMHP